MVSDADPFTSEGGGTAPPPSTCLGTRLWPGPAGYAGCATCTSLKPLLSPAPVGAVSPTSVGGFCFEGRLWGSLLSRLFAGLPPDAPPVLSQAPP